MAASEGGRRLRYSERKRLAETGALGDLQHEDARLPLRTAIRHFMTNPGVSIDWHTRFVHELTLHFGHDYESVFEEATLNRGVDELLDTLEIYWECVTVPTGSAGPALQARNRRTVEAEINRIFERHRFGYRMQDGLFHRIGSPALEAEVVGPTLLAVQRPGWDQVERSYREALDHRLAGEIDDALTAASAAVEAAMKAVGLQGSTFSELTRSYRQSALVPAYLSSVPERLDALVFLTGRQAAIRGEEGDAHGKESGAEEPPAELADLAIHWAGALIVFLAASPARE